MTKAIFGLATSEEQARRIIDSLLSAGFSNNAISIVYPDTTIRDTTRTERSNGEYAETNAERNMRKDHLLTEKHTKAPEGGVTGATIGGVLGGSLGLLAGIGALAVPGLGFFIAAGPIMAALSGTAVGGGVGLLIGAIIGAGIPEYEAKKYEAGLREGHILVSVHADNDTDIKRAYEIFKQEGAKDISSTNEKVMT